MKHVTVCLLLLALLRPLTSSDPEDEADNVAMEVIVDSSPCSATCGLGMRTQTLCLLKDGKTAMEEGVRSAERAEVSEECRVRRVTCLESWQCGLRTVTVTSGQRVQIDCLGEVMQAMGRFSWRVSWRHARGIISSDDSLFSRWDAPLLGRVVLDPAREEDAGTYRCDVQDPSFRMVKRIYWGIRVLPAGVLNLDYQSSLAQWDSAEDQQNQTASEQRDRRTPLLYTVLISSSLAGVGASLILLGLHWTVRRRGRRRFDGRSCCSFAHGISSLTLYMK